MPWLNRVFEEVGIIYWEREVPAEVLASIEKKKKKAYAKNVTSEAESKKRKGAVGSRAPVKKKKKSGAPLIVLALSSAGSASAASASSEDIESSPTPSTDARVASGGDRGSPVAPVCPTSGAVSGAGRPETGVVLACSSHGATSVGERPEDSAVEPMPDVLGGLCSSSEEDTEAILRHVPSSSATIVPSPVPTANVGWLEATLAEEALVARPSSSPPSVGPLAKEVRPFGPSPHDMVETSA
ncbi:cell wall protein TIR4-like [Miscanthus floridulus]|uniref:cell wall protein TIR4-like n=1 Tax=Miscanthus floridulus TaxID=154761 RepID=UPI003458B852